ncbi:Uncharacterised protein [Mycobacteroides abscessus subsp. abscessus]|nr:Uncharacterised protein [Mycobacteroides abscessus subsp. abscessus]
MDCMPSSKSSPSTVGDNDHEKWLTTARPGAVAIGNAANAWQRHRSPHGVRIPCRSARVANFISNKGAGMGRNRVKARSFAVKMRRSTLTYSLLRTAMTSIPPPYALTFWRARETSRWVKPSMADATKPTFRRRSKGCTACEHRSSIRIAVPAG